MNDGQNQPSRVSFGLCLQTLAMATATGGEEKAEEWEFHLQRLSTGATGSVTDPASDSSVLESVRKVCELCKREGSEYLAPRAYRHINKLFQRCVAAHPQSRAPAGPLLLALLQFFLDFGDVVLHDADPNLKSFFRSCLSREFADPIVAEKTLEFINLNKTKILASFPTLLPQFFPLILKLIAWNGEKLEEAFLNVLPVMLTSGSFLPLFSSLVDLPVLVVALEKVERSSGTLVGSSIASIQKSKAPEMLLALMDEAYTGSTIEDGAGCAESDDNNNIDVVDPVFLDLLKDENDGLAERQWASPAMTAALQATISSPQSSRLKIALEMTPRILDIYFALALQDVNESLVCALLPLLMSRNATLFPDRIFSFEVRRRLLEFLMATFERYPNFIALLKKPITDRLSEAYNSPGKTELALHLCWAIGEHGGGGIGNKDSARELFESLELLLYENLSTSRLGLRHESRLGIDDSVSRESPQTRLLCFVITAIAKLATYHQELLPRARVSLSKVARSRNTDARVWSRACDYLGLVNEPAVCLSILGPSGGLHHGPGVVNWHQGGSKLVSHLPFYILNGQEGPPFHDFAISDILPQENM